MVHDLIVIGGGPAGCSAAVSAARLGARVLLLERGCYPRQKVCGEFVSAESIGLLTSLLTEEDRQLLLGSAPRIARARVFLDHTVIEIEVSPSAVSISRMELDAALWRACEAAGVDTRQQVIVDRVLRESGFKVATSQGEFATRTVIDASGRRSNLASARAEPAATQQKWLGLKAHFVEGHPPDSVDLYFFDAGYCGVQKVANDIVNVCAMVRERTATRLDEVFELHPDLRARSREWRQQTKTFAAFPLIFRKPNPVRDGILCAGDAAGFIDPFAGDGISLGLASGAAAARMFRCVWAGEHDLDWAAESYRTDYNRRFGPALRNAALIRGFLSLPLPLRRIVGRAASMPAVSRRFVKMTRAA